MKPERMIIALDAECFRSYIYRGYEKTPLSKLDNGVFLMQKIVAHMERYRYSFHSFFFVKIYGHALGKLVCTHE